MESFPRRQEEDEAKSEVEMSDAGAAAGAAEGGVGADLEDGEVSSGAESDGEEEELKPLPDILTCISQKFRQVHTVYPIRSWMRLGGLEC